MYWETFVVLPGNPGVPGGPWGPGRELGALKQLTQVSPFSPETRAALVSVCKVYLQYHTVYLAVVFKHGYSLSISYPSGPPLPDNPYLPANQDAQALQRRSFVLLWRYLEVQEALVVPASQEPQGVLEDLAKTVLEHLFLLFALSPLESLVAHVHHCHQQLGVLGLLGVQIILR